MSSLDSLSSLLLLVLEVDSNSFLTSAAYLYHAISEVSIEVQIVFTEQSYIIIYIIEFLN